VSAYNLLLIAEVVDGAGHAGAYRELRPPTQHFGGQACVQTRPPQVAEAWRVELGSSAAPAAFAINVCSCPRRGLGAGSRC